ncbi:MAG: hypothetical protein R2788_02345 [Saprospiraceae bacterium]
MAVGHLLNHCDRAIFRHRILHGRYSYVHRRCERHGQRYCWRRHTGLYLYPARSDHGHRNKPAAGSYTVTVTDANGCTATCSTTVTQLLRHRIVHGQLLLAAAMGTGQPALLLAVVRRAIPYVWNTAHNGHCDRPECWRPTRSP